MKLHLTKTYGEKKVLEDFRAEIAEGEMTCMLGQSGCGKTTVLNCIAGLVPFEGEIEGRPEEISYIFQRERLLPNLTVRGNLSYVLSGKKLPDERERIDRVLQAVELLEEADRIPRELSGGMAQRVSLARGFVYPSALLLMDEPFQGLDLALKFRVIDQFFRMRERDGRTVLLVTHSVDEALLVSDRILLLGEGGRIADDFRIQTPAGTRKISDAACAAARDRIFASLGV